MSEKKIIKRRTHVEIMLAKPGIRQAYMLAMKATLRSSMNKDGEVDEIKSSELILKLTKKISELWELSPMMEQYLIQRWAEGATTKSEPMSADEYIGYLYRDKTKDRGQNLLLEFVLAENNSEKKNLNELNSKLENNEAKLVTIENMRQGHIYLDVTFIDYKALRNAYESVKTCRKLLDLETSDVRRGAPESMDFTRALAAARGEERGLSRKELAKIMGFKIYTGENPSGSYPLLQKYLRVGKWILKRLNKLEEYIHELTGIDPDTL
jgi:hypothetical protein